MRTARLNWVHTLLASSGLCLSLFGAPNAANADTLNVTIPTGNTGTSEYVIFFVQIVAGGNTADSWFETTSPVLTGTPPQLTVKDTSGADLTLSNARYFVSDTLIPLDQLNMTDLPPSDPRFSSLPSLDGALAPNASFSQGGSETGSPESLTAGVTPLPPAWILMLTGLVGFGLFAARRHRSGGDSLAVA